MLSKICSTKIRKPKKKKNLILALVFIHLLPATSSTLEFLATPRRRPPDEAIAASFCAVSGRSAVGVQQHALISSQNVISAFSLSIIFLLSQRGYGGCNYHLPRQRSRVSRPQEWFVFFFSRLLGENDFAAGFAGVEKLPPMQAASEENVVVESRLSACAVFRERIVHVHQRRRVYVSWTVVMRGD